MVGPKPSIDRLDGIIYSSVYYRKVKSYAWTRALGHSRGIDRENRLHGDLVPVDHGVSSKSGREKERNNNGCDGHRLANER
jgi:hypothetical protein